jgi:hypothetical protein
LSKSLKSKKFDLIFYWILMRVNGLSKQLYNCFIKHIGSLKVRKVQNAYMKSLHCPKYEWKK